MKTLTLALLLLLSGMAIGEETLSFAGTQYLLSWVNVAGDTITNEYFEKGANENSWSSMVAVRYFKGKTISDVLPKYMEQIRPVLAAKPDIVKKADVPASEDVTLVLFLLAPDKSYYEYNLHRFAHDSAGVRSYQFAQRIPFKERLDVSDIIKQQPSRIEELGALTKVAVEKDGGR